MSEGINFSDDLGRLGLFLLARVIPIDLPTSLAHGTQQKALLKNMILQLQHKIN